MENFHLNSGTYVYLDKLGFDASEKLSILRLYADTLGIEKPKGRQNKKLFYMKISEIVQEDFKSFQKFTEDNLINF